MSMKVALKIWRYDPIAGERKLEEHEFDAPEWVTLLDCLDIIKDQIDGTLAYRKSCRMMICGSCGMRMDGAAVLACKTRMYDIVQSGHVPVISAMGNMPIVKDLVTDMQPFWGKIRAMSPWLEPGYQDPGEKEFVVSQEEIDTIHKESLCIMCGCCVSECNSMEADPEFLGPAALAKGMRFVGDPRDQAKVERLQEYSNPHGIWDCTRCYFCQERCPKGVDPLDAIAKLGAEAMKEGIDSDMGAKHAKWFVTSAKTTGWLRETELVPKTQGIVRSLKEVKFAMGLAKHGKVPPPFPPHVAKDVDESRKLYDLVKQQGRDGAAGIVQGEHALGRLEFERGGQADRDPYGEDSFPRPYLPGEGESEEAGRREDGRVLQGLPGVAQREGARHVDAGARAEGRVGADRARARHVLRRERHPRGGARLSTSSSSGGSASPCAPRAGAAGRASRARSRRDDRGSPSIGRMFTESHLCQLRARRRGLFVPGRGRSPRAASR